jgi:hypothetical protein
LGEEAFANPARAYRGGVLAKSVPLKEGEGWDGVGVPMMAMRTFLLVADILECCCVHDGSGWLDADFCLAVYYDWSA